MKTLESPPLLGGFFMKKCSRCKIEKEKSEFHKKSKSKDGLDSHCKVCENQRQLKYKQENIDHVRKLKRENAEKHKEKRHEYQKNKYYSDLEKSRQISLDKYYKKRDLILERNRKKQNTPEGREKSNERARKWRYRNKDLHNAYQRYYRRKNKIKIGAVQKVNDALRRGRLKKPLNCETCNKEDPKLQGHHHDYNKPLDVVWLCKDCHCKIHGKLVDVI